MTGRNNLEERLSPLLRAELSYQTRKELLETAESWAYSTEPPERTADTYPENLGDWMYPVKTLDDEMLVKVVATVKEAGFEQEAKRIVQRGIKFCLEKQDLERAAKLANGVGNTRTAKLLYLRVINKYAASHMYQNALHTAQEANLPEKEREVSKKAIHYHEQKNEYLIAAEYAEEIQLVDKADRLFLKVSKDFERKKKYDSAAKYSRKAHDEKRYRAMCLKQSFVYEKEGSSEDAVHFALQAEDKKRAMLLCEKSKNFSQAEKLAKELDDSQQAKVYEQLAKILS